MKSSVKTNRLDYELNREEIQKLYDIFAVTTSEKHFNGGAKILDAQELDGRIKSVLFEYGNSMLVLAGKDAFTISGLRSVLSGAEGADSTTVSRQDAGDVEDRKLLQLLLNGLGNYDTDFLRFSNLTGHCYSFHPQWLKHGKKENGHMIWQVPCLELKITPDMCLSFPVRTFTSVRLKSRMKFEGRKFQEYPQYVMTGKNTLRRKLNEDEGNAFILRQLDDRKTEIPFLDIKDLGNFEKSKLGLIESTLRLFNLKYEGIAKAGFAVVKNYGSVDYTRACAREDAARIREYLSRYAVRITDTIRDGYSARFCDDICRLLYEKYGIRAAVGKRISKTALNIRLIHNEEYYDSAGDPHKAFTDAAVQHITFEDFAGSADFAITTVIHEVMIKQDILDRRISLFDWSSLNMEEAVSFGLPAKISGKDFYIFMKIMPDGSFEFLKEEFDLFHIQQYQDCINIFEDAKVRKENILGLIRFSDNTVNVIKDTGWITLPELGNIHEELTKGNTKLRGKQAREAYLAACIDVRAFEENKAAYYFVGTIGEGMRYTLRCASNIRKIEPYKDAQLKYDYLLPLMSVTFVRNGQLTVVPFPFKYLREYAEQLRLQ